MRRILPALCLALFAWIGGGAVAAADATAEGNARAPGAEKPFDIPAGDAFSTLKRFATQSGAQLIYQAEALEGVRTTAIRGRFTSREALGRMLVRTDLAVTQDAKTGTLAITRATNGSDSAAGLTSSTKKKSPSP